MKKHLVFIVNPRSGTDRVKAVNNTIEETLDASQYNYEVLATKYPKHGITLARAAADNGAFGVIAIGGDGSVNDVVAGLAGTKTALGIIPRGSGNGMARSIELPLNDEGCLQVINKANVVGTDLGYANERPYISNAGVGFDALIAREFAKSKTRGLKAYSWLITKNIWSFKEPEWRIHIDGKLLRERAFLVNVANGKQFGYNFKIAPNASITDGMLDVIIIKKFPKIMGASLAALAINGDITTSRYVTHFRCKEASISHPELQLMQIDGDPHACPNKINFRVEPGAINVFMP